MSDEPIECSCYKLPRAEDGLLRHHPDCPNRLKWADLWAIDPDFGDTTEAAEQKRLIETATRLGEAIGRATALKEVGDEIALESENPKYVVVQMDKNTYLMLVNAQYASQPPEAPSEPLAASTGHSDLPEGGEGL